MVYRNNAQQAYTVASGTTATSTTIFDQRDPTSNDIYYALGTFWINQLDIKLWYLNRQSNASGQLQSTWELISVESVLATLSGDILANVVTPSTPFDSPPDNIQLIGANGITVTATGAHQLTIANTGIGTETLTGDDGVAVSPDITGTIQTLGNVVANATHAKALFTTNPSGNIEQWDIQLSAAIASTDVTKVGLAAFDTAFFTVDANGFVSANGGALVEKVNLQTGTTPITPISGAITFNGATVAAGTHPVRTDGTGAHTMALEVQISQAIAATDATKIGLSNFSSSQFAVDANGFVTLAGGSGPGILTINSIGPNGSGNFGLLGTANQIAVTGGVNLDTLSLIGPYTPATYTAHGVLIGEGSSSIVATTPGTNGQTLLGSTGADPVFATLSSSDSSITFTTGPGTLSLQVAGGTTTIKTITGDSNGPESPSGGNFNLFGSGSITTVGSASTETIQLTGLTNHNVLIGAGTSTITKVAPSATSGVPLISQGASADPVFGTAVVAGGGTGDTSFTAYAVICGGTTSTNPLQNVSGVGTANQVLTSNGAGLLPTWQASSSSGAVTQFTLDAGTTPITPTAGNIVITGAQVATGVVGINVIRSDGTASNAVTLQIQRSTTSGVSNSALNGVAHFSSTNFTVDANGFVQFVGGSSSFPWTDEGAPFNAASNNGYFVTVSTTGTLPPTPAQGDIVRILSDTTGVVTVQANTGQFIRLGTKLSASAGTAASTQRGDAIDLVYRASSGTWYVFEGSVGGWNIT